VCPGSSTNPSPSPTDAPCQKVCKSHSRFTKSQSWTTAASSLPATDQRRQPRLGDPLLADTGVEGGLGRCWHPVDRLRSGLYSSIPVTSFLPQGRHTCPQSPCSSWPSTSSSFTHFGKLQAQGERDWSHPTCGVGIALCCSFPSLIWHTSGQCRGGDDVPAVPVPSSFPPFDCLQLNKWRMFHFL